MILPPASTNAMNLAWKLQIIDADTNTPVCTLHKASESPFYLEGPPQPITRISHSLLRILQAFLPAAEEAAPALYEAYREEWQKTHGATALTWEELSMDPSKETIVRLWQNMARAARTQALN